MHQKRLDYSLACCRRTQIFKELRTAKEFGVCQEAKCAANEIAEKEIAALQTELATTRVSAEEKTRKLEMELAGFRERLSAMEEVKLTLTAVRDEAVRVSESPTQ